MKKNLYVFRPVLNGDDILKWADNAGFAQTFQSKDLHVTIMYSKKEVEWNWWEPVKNKLTISGGIRRIELFGENKNVAVLQFESKKLWLRHKQFLDGGCSFDYQVYKPHISITYNAPKFMTAPPYEGNIVLGPEEFQKIDEDYLSKVTEK